MIQALRKKTLISSFKTARGRLLLTGFATLLASLASMPASALGFSDPGGYGLKIYRVNSGLYPYVQVYFRTFDQEQNPLVNLNAMNIGLMVKGRAYDPMKRQYNIGSIRQRQEATRSVLILDASKSMTGAPFLAAQKAATRYIDSKRPQDEVAILSIRDTKTGYDIVSDFERDPGALGRRLFEVVPDGNRSRIYDTIGAAMQMCGMSAQGSVTPGIENYIISCSIVVFSDGYDEGSAISREELNGRITALGIPVPIYSLAYSKKSREHFKNLESLSKNSFGIYYLIGEAIDEMQKTVERIQNILQSDYVLTFRSVVEVDGEEHAIKVGVEYPTGSGKFYYESAKMEAIQPPPVPAVLQQIQVLDGYFPALPEGMAPYMEKPAEALAAPPAQIPAAPAPQGTQAQNAKEL
ncbi:MULTISPECIES: vWA domain-containing protein [Methylomicrobium]|nr:MULTISPECIES: VWA domain-containing protein [Methylomicrobium]